MNRYLYLCLLLATSTLFGCATAPHPQFNASAEFWQNTEQKVGVYVADLPEVKGHITGAGCLLCLATAAAINADLSDHMRDQSTAGLADLEEKLITALQAKGLNATAVQTPLEIEKIKEYRGSEPNAAERDFRPLKKLEALDKVLVLHIRQLGTIRKFANYIPVGDPYVVLKGTMSIINLDTNQYEYYESIDIDKFSDTPWDEPGYPGLTNAYYTVLELAKRQILDLEVDVPAPAAPDTPEKTTATKQTGTSI